MSINPLAAGGCLGAEEQSKDYANATARIVASSYKLKLKLFSDERWWSGMRPLHLLTFKDKIC